MKLISLLLGLPLLALGASLKARSLPDVDAGCKICHPGDPAYAKWQADVKSVPQTLINEGKQSFSKSFPPGTQPALCSHAGVSCVHLEPGFVWEKNPASLIQDPVGKYSMTDGRTIYAFLYWNHMQKFKSTNGGGSVNWYPAHCVIELVVNSGAKATAEGKTYLPGGGFHNQGKYCLYDYYTPVTVSA
ncbi:hypothetical protein CKM354_000779000 [Cercospora kikuchii]|uniref:Uncharacterized protein n=1 Tax=Cercospora kikuchii TaxID=84275 RepID=A0A9P3FEN3_9PEZI|nr:uncharacterized protein CKM354_000779000 [Cercospora kikuchii]GIZ44596.1 hypothetical protein CKM354_000779000 [Cercospora kikuchii]